jgi:hypothetical protein
MILQTRLSIDRLMNEPPVNDMAAWLMMDGSY